jgi:hypothetical protein
MSHFAGIDVSRFQRLLEHDLLYLLDPCNGWYSKSEIEAWLNRYLNALLPMRVRLTTDHCEGSVIPDNEKTYYFFINYDDKCVFTVAITQSAQQPPDYFMITRDIGAELS